MHGLWFGLLCGNFGFGELIVLGLIWVTVNLVRISVNFGRTRSEGIIVIKI